MDAVAPGMRANGDHRKSKVSVVVSVLKQICLMKHFEQVTEKVIVVFLRGGNVYVCLGK